MGLCKIDFVSLSYLPAQKELQFGLSECYTQATFAQNKVTTREFNKALFSDIRFSALEIGEKNLSTVHGVISHCIFQGH